MTFYRNTVFLLKGLREFTKGGYERASKEFTADALDVDLTGEVAIITGANSGIGKSVATSYAKRGGTVHMICRNLERAEEAKNEIIKESGNDQIYIHIVDLSNLHDIQKFVQSFKEQYDKVNVLINNGGCMVNERQETKEGVEINFATNTLGTFYLTTSLLDVLEKSKPSRVVTVSSGGMLTERLNLADLEMKERAFDGTFAYAHNKRQQVILTEVWNERFFEKGISFYSCHPGWADTPGVEKSMPSFHQRLNDKLRTADEGADSVFWLAIAKEVNEKIKSGDFVQDRQSVSKHLPLARTHNTQEEAHQLYSILEDYVKRILNPTNQNENEDGNVNN